MPRGRRGANTGKVPEVPITGDVIPKPERVIEVHVDVYSITWGDYKTLQNFNGKITPEIYELLDRIVVGGITRLPLIGSIEPILQAISEAMEDASLKQPPGTARANGHKPKEPEAPNRGN